MADNDGISITLIIILFIILIAWLISILVMYFTEKGLFAPYKHPQAPKNSVYPIGDLKPLTKEQKEKKKELISKFVDLD